ncbi:hypothetical protein G7L40_00575 [Paenibacillus polymyxa]|uniref:Uncharacterized protein n=1 Tax=Paenibacillus polymyxa TaxID=1406 RepID=A0A378XV41_PAEPO|nr:hypothetical protein [Paenibacillus polymyxa]MBE7897204.1 hypothetical protein [Paenibacillus polymyxa]MBG9763057.1 hypothetical protein [Paenibacillus polymyxa]MCC3257546.1 hypothetical protein [Paenibacillus polymyxa]QPK51367.1 hypothetical protein G7035_00570 [Paenibacillus polymyxa]QPK56458.1 hypothetical protein G7L40_00575 [Paenibacillus polymyxa]
MNHMPIGTVAKIKEKEVKTAFPKLIVAGLPVSHNEIAITIYDVSPKTVAEIQKYINKNNENCGYNIYINQTCSDSFDELVQAECFRRGYSYRMNGSKKSYVYFDRIQVVDDLFNVLDADNNVFNPDSINPITFLKALHGVTV